MNETTMNTTGVGAKGIKLDPKSFAIGAASGAAGAVGGYFITKWIKGIFIKKNRARIEEFEDEFDDIEDTDVKVEVVEEKKTKK